MKIANYNMSKKNLEAEKVILSGIGVHVSDLIQVGGTDVTFGDCVNVSSKMGEEIADHSEILITQEIYSEVESALDTGNSSTPVFGSKTTAEKRIVMLAGKDTTVYEIKSTERRRLTSELIPNLKAFKQRKSIRRHLLGITLNGLGGRMESISSFNTED